MNCANGAGVWYWPLVSKKLPLRLENRSKKAVHAQGATGLSQ